LPELPEVETVRRGIAPHLLSRRIARVRVHQRRLRWPVPHRLAAQAPGQRIEAVRRRAKYLIVDLQSGHLLIHLGMSGSLRILSGWQAPAKHDHIDIELDSGACLRFHDPRRFGSMLWTTRSPEHHRLLKGLGPEPLAPEFSGAGLYTRSRGRRAAVKSFIMDAHTVVGVGNIYASEALYLAGIHPTRPAGRIAERRYEVLAAAIRHTLNRAIECGGSTLRDFSDENGTPGYFTLDLNVYGREGEPCRGCGRPVRRRVIGQRASYFCPGCQR
jgi:formamidopyrimidine-DNA glycosylase